MLTGDVPFKANYDYQVFQMITDRKVDFPNYLTEDAVDLIDKLMQLNPYERLGAGALGTPNDYENLKQHPFFKSINFKKLHATSPPVPVERFKAAFQSVNAKPKDKSQAKYFEDHMDDDDKDDIIDFLAGELSEGVSKIQHDQKKFDPLQPLDPKTQLKVEATDMLIKSGIVYKKKGILGNLKRKLILTNQPRLYYLNEQGLYKADILITPYVRATCTQSDRFEIRCSQSGKSLILRVVGEDAQIWATKINRVIDAHTKAV